MKLIKPLLLLAVLFICSCVSVNSPTDYLPISKEEAAKQVDAVMAELSLEEKVELLHGMGIGQGEFGDDDSPAFGVLGVERLGIPYVYMGHGLTGTRVGRASTITSTYFCTPIGMGCTWDLDLYSDVGTAIAKEMRALGQDLNLGPTVNIIRHPLGGRTWESLSEDPFLSARFIVPYVQAMQQTGIICGPKHFAANNQENNRFDINNVMDERTLREIYLPAFKAAVMEGGALNLMGSYNRLNGTFMCENKFVLTDILRKEWGFEGFVLSDFGNGVRSTLGAADAGLNIEMHAGKYYGEPMIDEIKKGNLTEERVDELLREYLMVVYRMDIPNRERYAGFEIRTQQALDLARKVAQESPVLLKNTSTLPLKASDYKSIAVIGPNAKKDNEGPKLGHKWYYMQGGGSGRTYYFDDAVVEPYTGIAQAVASDTKVVYAQGCLPPHAFTQATRGNKDNPTEKKLIAEAVNTAKSSDMVVLMLGLTGANETEGWDRSSALLPGCQEELIDQVCAVNDNVVAVVAAGSYVDMSKWQDKVKSILFVPYCGEQVGHGIADLLFGKVSPSGKLPFTWVNSIADYPEGSILTGPGYSKTNVSNVYSEGIYVGYRWFDKENIDVLYPFGYGLSYTTFEYSNIKVSKKSKYNYQVTVEVTNTGDFDCDEIAQLYINDVESSFDRPENELKGFAKVSLGKGETKTVTFDLNEESFSYFNPETKAWVVESGDFIISVGKNSRDLCLNKKLTI